MSLATLIETAIEAQQDHDDPSVSWLSEPIAEEVITALKEDSLRREVWEEIKYSVNEGVSISDVHTVIDGLIKSLQGVASNGS